MTEEVLRATTTIKASTENVFAVLADPAKHAAIDGTGWVCKPVDGDPLTRSGQIFRMGMFHKNHPDGNYEIGNRVESFDPPRAISWQPGYDATGSGELQFGGWIWRYDLTPAGPDETKVTLSYDWSAVGPEARKDISFPPFEFSRPRPPRPGCHYIFLT
ncbi:SRPBCC family protein [Sporichthya sp.]|uniref:SRPBCC family protein n=1 Tax=Sporichthya sp. TaxID=65475 RepID=UPI0017EAFB2C|nr:SRPBCC family protein [Sporichthya sp.]MBA3742546.1 SRPBCC family protein [Sporichthya sp.]